MDMANILVSVKYSFFYLDFDNPEETVDYNTVTIKQTVEYLHD